MAADRANRAPLNNERSYDRQIFHRGAIVNDTTTIRSISGALSGLRSCRNICVRTRSRPGGCRGSYINGLRKCSICDAFFQDSASKCSCCGARLRSKPRGRKLRTNLRKRHLEKQRIVYAESLPVE
ncbi:MAG: hypothetical protein HRF40_04675 [Nitrososphaera sp.]